MESALGRDLDRQQLIVRGSDQQLVALAGPAASRRILHAHLIPRSRLRERLYEKPVSTRIVGNVGKPFAVGRDRRTALLLGRVLIDLGLPATRHGNAPEIEVTGGVGALSYQPPPIVGPVLRVAEQAGSVEHQRIFASPVARFDVNLPAACAEQTR